MLNYHAKQAYAYAYPFIYFQKEGKNITTFTLAMFVTSIRKSVKLMVLSVEFMMYPFTAASRVLRNSAEAIKSFTSDPLGRITSSPSV